jgi:selenocysteine lyase/cysteine desulfurase
VNCSAKRLLTDSGNLAAGERRDDDIRKFEEIGTHPAANYNAHSSNPEMSCGIGTFGLNGADARKLTDALQTSHNIYTSVSSSAEYTGIRVTPSVYTTLAEMDYFVSAVEKN